MMISHCFRKLAKSNNGVIHHVAWLGLHPIVTLFCPLGRDSAIRKKIHSTARAMPLRGQQGPRQLNGPQASEGHIVEARIPQHTRSDSSHVGSSYRCEGSQNQGHSSWLGLKGTGESQGGSGPTFPVKSGKHGQSQGTGVHISSPTFEANPLVPTTPLDDTINTLP